MIEAPCVCTPLFYDMNMGVWEPEAPGRNALCAYARG